MRKMENNLFRLLRSKSYREGEFTLASGKKSNFYIDCKKTFLSSFGIRLASKELSSYISDDITYVAGEGVGGSSLAIGVSMYMFYTRGLPVCPVIVRAEAKDHGTKRRVEYDDTPYIPDLDRLIREIVLVEDVLTTGKSSLNAVKALIDAKFKVVSVIALVDRLEGASKLFTEEFGNDVKIISLFNRHDFS